MKINNALTIASILLAVLASYWVLNTSTDSESKAAYPDAGVANRSSSTIAGITSKANGAPVDAEEVPSLGSTVAEAEELLGEAWPPRIDSPEDLERFAAWMQTLSHEELLRMSNAEFNFKGSPIVDLLHQLEGEWVVSALGNLAIAETSTLLKSVLVEGLCGTASFARCDDENFIPILSGLLIEFSVAELDPFGVGIDLIDCSFASCLRQGVDYCEMIEPHLAESDNGTMLVAGYMFMGSSAAAKDILSEALVGHASDEGRRGAMLGLGHSVADGLVSPEDATSLGLLALDGEQNDRNRAHLLSMLGSSGGEAGIRALEEMLLSMDPTNMGGAAKMLALKGDPEATLGLIEQSLLADGIDDASRGEMYVALSLLSDGSGTQLLVDVAGNPDLSIEARSASLKALWNSELDESVSQALEDLVGGEGDAELRAEALRLLHTGDGSFTNLNLREIASQDQDPEVRSEAIVLASMEPNANNREWLEERLMLDSSMDVRAAALGSLVMHAHYSGGGDAALSYLNRAESFTNDAEVLGMIQKGKEMVSEFDPRNLDLGLAEDAKFYGNLSRLTDGVASRTFQRQSEQLYKVISALRASTR